MSDEVLLIQFNDSGIKVVEKKCVSCQLIKMQLIDFILTHLFSTTFILPSLKCMSSTSRIICGSDRISRCYNA